MVLVQLTPKAKYLLLSERDDEQRERLFGIIYAEQVGNYTLANALYSAYKAIKCGKGGNVCLLITKGLKGQIKSD